MIVRHPALAGLRILVIEDDPLVSLMVEEMLHELQCLLVAAVHTVNAALEAIREHATEIDGVLLDLQLGGRSSAPVIRELLHRSLPFLVTSGSAIGADTPAAVASVPWLMKPFTVDALAGRMVQAFGARAR